MTGIIICLALVFVLFFVRQQTRPLARLVEKMYSVRAGNMDEYVEVEGTEEIRELTETYNQMIRSLNDYIEKIVQTEKEKRTAEIHALQMQINPHYMYNTLTSIKMLIWQGNVKLSTQVIDAFVLLLRNTISNTEELIPVREEIENLKRYVLINQARYGDAVQVEYYISYAVASCLVPKLILQPFVENAFFHGFPEGQRGVIQIFARQQGEDLLFEIVDNGAGMTAERLEGITNKREKKKEHFTGIGVNNVSDRIKLIYGADYGINIESEEKKGTKVIIRIPRQEHTAQK